MPKNKNIKEKESNTFIGDFQIKDKKLMSEIIDFFEKNKEFQQAARFGNYELDKSKKDALEITISPKQLTDNKHQIFAKYFDYLKISFNEYLNTWPFLRSIGKISSGSFHVQKYNPGGHYNSWHTERDSLKNSERVLVFMTYLNTLKGSGETEFLHYGVKFEPTEGRTIIWPAEWTHAHKGLPVKETKYIITGWIGFR